MWDVGTGAVVHSLSGHDSATVGYLGVGRTGAAAITGSADHRLCLWDTVEGSLTKQLPTQQGSRVKDMAFDGRYGQAAECLLGSVCVMDVAFDGRRGQAGESRGCEHKGLKAGWWVWPAVPSCCMPAILLFELMLLLLLWVWLIDCRPP